MRSARSDELPVRSIARSAPSGSRRTTARGHTAPAQATLQLPPHSARLRENRWLSTFLAGVTIPPDAPTEVPVNLTDCGILHLSDLQLDNDPAPACVLCKYVDRPTSLTTCLSTKRNPLSSEFILRIRCSGGALTTVLRNIAWRLTDRAPFGGPVFNPCHRRCRAETTASRGSKFSQHPVPQFA